MVELHCNYCMCPKDIYEPFKSYPHYDGCKLYDDFLSLFHEDDTPPSFKEFENLVKESYEKVLYPEAVFDEFIQIGFDLGVISESVQMQLFESKEKPNSLQEEKLKYGKKEVL